MADMVVVAIEEMSNSIQEVVRHASDSAQKSEVGLEEATKGKVAVQATVESVNDLAKNLADSMVVITDLEKQSNEIGSVIEVIQSISEKTNLLAIEAARAGDQGRGFAVVADEVRTLAQRTQDSTAEITDNMSVIKDKLDETKEITKQARTASIEVNNMASQLNSMASKFTIYRIIP